MEMLQVREAQASHDKVARFAAGCQANVLKSGCRLGTAMVVG